MRISDWSSDVCSSDLLSIFPAGRCGTAGRYYKQWLSPGCIFPSSPGPNCQSCPVSSSLRHRSARESRFGMIRRRSGPPAPAESWIQDTIDRSEEHTSELQSLMRISYAVFCLKKKKTDITHRDYIA